MTDDKNRPAIDPQLDKALSELLEQAGQEPISPRLRDLAGQLQAALDHVRQQSGDGGAAESDGADESGAS